MDDTLDNIHDVHDIHDVPYHDDKQDVNGNGFLDGSTSLPDEETDHKARPNVMVVQDLTDIMVDVAGRVRDASNHSQHIHMVNSLCQPLSIHIYSGYASTRAHSSSSDCLSSDPDDT